MNIFGAEVPFASLCGIEPVSYADGVSRLRLQPQPGLANNHGFLHGGVLSGLLDIGLASAARCSVGLPVVTVSLQLAFLKAARGPVSVEGRVVKSGRSLIFCEGEISDEAGEIVATATAIMKPVNPSAPA